MSIQVWDRALGRTIEEKVYGDKWVRWLYETPAGNAVADGLLSRKLPSVLYGAWQASPMSRGKIAPFVRAYEIPMELFEAGPFANFNEFFIRKFRPGVRHFADAPGRMPAFCEARYLAWDRVHPEQLFPVKGTYLSPEALLGNPDEARAFDGGALMIARLCPVDYHRFHFPDDGKVLRSWRVAGRYHSVNPAALRYRNDVFAINERQVSILETRNFGRIAYVEVGALCVGRIVQSFQGPEFRRGEEKGYLLYGGSTVIVLGQAGAWKPDADLTSRTAEKVETLVRLGEPVASAGA